MSHQMNVDKGCLLIALFIFVIAMGILFAAILLDPNIVNFLERTEDVTEPVQFLMGFR